MEHVWCLAHTLGTSHGSAQRQSSWRQRRLVNRRTRYRQPPVPSPAISRYSSLQHHAFCHYAACRSACVSSVSSTAPPAPATVRWVTTTRSFSCIGGSRGAVWAGFPFNPNLVNSACTRGFFFQNEGSGRERMTHGDQGSNCRPSSTYTASISRHTMPDKLEGCGVDTRFGFVNASNYWTTEYLEIYLVYVILKYMHTSIVRF